MEKIAAEINEPARVKNFARFFKNYMSIWSIVIAALPIPVTALNLIPVFAFQKQILSTYTTLFCFLILGFIFFSRHRLTKFFFPTYYLGRRRIVYYRQLDEEIEKIQLTTSDENERKKLIEDRRHYTDVIYSRTNRSVNFKAGIVDMLPMFFILLSIGSAFCYNNTIDNAILAKTATTRKIALESESLPAYASTLLMASYLGIFLFAETAFILMAIKEFLQDLLHLSDESLMVREFKHFSS